MRLPIPSFLSALGCCLLLATCTGVTPAPSSGVTVDYLQLESERLVAVGDLFPETSGPHHVFAIDRPPAGPGDLLVVTSHGAVWLDHRGRVVRRSPFGGASFFPARSIDLSGGKLGFLALRNEGFARGSRGELVLLDGDGRRLIAVPAGYASDFFATDLDGDGRPELVVETAAGRGVEIYSLAGSRIGGFDLGAYVSALAPVDSDGDGKPEILVYLYPVDEAGELRVLRLDGTVVAESAAAAVGDVAVLPGRSGRGDRVALLVGDELRILDARAGTGTEGVERLAAPEGETLQDLEVALLDDGRRVTLASGGGDLDAHMVLVHAATSAGGSLLYRRVDRGRARGLHVELATGGGLAIYYGVEDSVRILRSAER